MSTFEVVPSPVMSSYTECVWTYANESGCGLPVPLPLVPVGMPWDAVFAKEGGTNVTMTTLKRHSPFRGAKHSRLWSVLCPLLRILT